MSLAHFTFGFNFFNYLKWIKGIPCGLPPDASRLKLHQNRIQNIYLGQFEDFEGLKKLELDSNPLKTIAKKALDGLRLSLEQLSLKQDRTRIENMTSTESTNLSFIVI